MPALKLYGFDGEQPRTSATALGDNQAQTANNVKLYSKELRYWRGPSLEHTTSITPATIFKLYGTGGPIWLAWEQQVDVARSPLADTTESRIYYTGNGTPKKTNYAMAASGAEPYPATYLELGVPAPTNPPAVSTTGGSGSTETRAYVYTFVSEFGTIVEESAPSPASALVNVLTGGSVTVTTFDSPPVGNYNITKIRIYRTVTGATTDSYQYVTELSVGTTSYIDTLTAAQLGETISTIGWLPPPSDLEGLIALPNGVLAGFVGNTVYFSEPYYAHAWPRAYAISVPSNVVGLGSFGATIVVATERHPYIINGGTPGAMSAEEQPFVEPCVGRRTITSDEFGVMYASPNGLVSIGYAQRGVITNGLFRRDEWQALNPSLIRAAIYDGKYFGIYPGLSAGKALVISRDDVPALSFLELNATAVHVDDQQATLYVAKDTDGDIYQVDADEMHPISYQWKSKRFFLPTPTTFSALRMDADFDQTTDADAYNETVAEIAAENATLWASPLHGAINEAALNTYDVNGSTLINVPPAATSRTVQVVLYGDGELAAQLQVSSLSPLRIPPFKSRDFEVEILGNVNVRSLVIGTTVRELLE